MDSASSQGFNPDRPIESSDQDKLQRAGFAHQLAERILSWHGQESLVIGLYGNWGSGKSSVKNLILERLSKEGERAPVVAEFNPWLVSGEEKITQAFFNEVGSKLEDFQKDPSADARTVTWKKYARALEVASQVAGTFDLVSPAFGIVAPGAGAWAAKRLKQAKELADQAAGSLEKRAVSLQELKRELRAYFLKLNNTLLVVIDDIDRLTTDEICLVFRLVKANADFPNTIFLLLFQRETAESALDTISKDKGPEFLQKIVQVGFDLPAPSPASLQQVLLTQLEQILAPVVREGEWENERWVNLWAGGLSRYFTTVREIYRFLNSFTFMLSAFEGGGTLEVNPIDLIAVECLRVFEPLVYATIRDNKSLLTQAHRHEERTDVQALAKQLLEAATCNAENAKQVLRSLFPELMSVWDNYFYGSEWYRKWTAQRRACSPDFFDRYFILRLPPGQVSESTVRAILAVSNDRQKLRKIFTELEGEGLLLAAIDRLEAEESLDKLKEPLPYLLALADVSDLLPMTQRRSFIIMPGSSFVCFAVIRVLQRNKEPEAKTAIISTLIRDSQCIGLSAEWIVDVANPKEDSPYPKIEGDALVALKNSWLERIKAAARDGRLLSVSALRLILQCWLEWTSPSEVGEWVSSLFSDAQQTLAFLKAHVNEASAQTIGSYYRKDTAWLSWKSLEQFQPRGKWEQVSERLVALDNLSEDEKRTLRLFQGAMKRWKVGVDDSNMRLPERVEDQE